MEFRHSKVVADAGYENGENYVFLEKNGQTAFIKPANYEISKKRKYQNDIGRIENLNYDETKDSDTCQNEKELPLAHIRHSKSKTSYVSEKHIYQSHQPALSLYPPQSLSQN